MTNRYYAIAIASVATGIPAPTIRRWISEGKLYALTHNGRRYITVQSVLDARDTPIRRNILNKARK